jgi:hypothetical protein
MDSDGRSITLRDLARRSDEELPLGVTCINMLYALRCHLHLMNQIPRLCPCCGTNIKEEYTASQSNNGASIRGFGGLLLTDSDAFFHVFAIAVLLMSKLWDERFGGLRSADADSRGDLRLAEFPTVLRDARQRVMDALAAKPKSAAELASLVNIEFLPRGAHLNSTHESPITGSSRRRANKSKRAASPPEDSAFAGFAAHTGAAARAPSPDAGSDRNAEQEPDLLIIPTSNSNVDYGHATGVADAATASSLHHRHHAK